MHEAVTCNIVAKYSILKKFKFHFTYLSADVAHLRKR